MKLRLKMTLAIIAVGLLVRWTISGSRTEVMRQAREVSASSFTRAHMALGGRQRCEAAPASWQEAWSDAQEGPTGVALFAYDSSLRSRHSGAPPIEPALSSRLEPGVSSASVLYPQDGRFVEDVLVRMPWTDGPCAVVLTRRAGAPPLSTGGAPRPWMMWFPLLATLVVVPLVVAPIVRRIRRLVSQVERSARQEYRIEVEDRGTDEIAELARAFNAARRQIRAQLDRLEQRERALRVTMSDTSHDVMIPLTTLRLQLEQLRRGLNDGPVERGELVGAALEEAHYLTALIQNLAVAARLDAGAPELVRHPVDLNALVARVLARHRPLAAQREVSLEGGVPDHPVRTEGDVTMIEQAVNNVVHNAIRYNRPGGHVALVLDDMEGGAVLRVLDDGPGIPEEERSGLIDRSARGEEARRLEPEGRGLGLAITRRVADAHGWPLALGRSEAGGLEVTLSVPVGA